MASDTKDIRSGDVIEDDRVQAVKAVGAVIHIIKFACIKYFHHKREGDHYRIGEAKLQSARPIKEGQRLTVYVDGDGQLWARPVTEFHDGRFEPAL